MKNRYISTKINLIIAVLVLSVFGIIMQYSASSYNALKETGDAFFYVKKQVISLVVAILALGGAMFVPTRIYEKFKLLIFTLSIVLLAIVFIPGLGVEKYGARRWINLGFFTIQPSEVAKFGLIIFIAGEIAKRPTFTFKAMLPIFLATGIMAFTIMMQPNMSITMLICLSMLIMLVVGGAKFKHFAILAVPLVIMAIVLVMLEPYRLKRLMAFINPWASPRDEGFQLIQSFYALSSGGMFGLGLFNSRQKYSFLPFAESDFIFAIIGEELGLVGTIAVIVLFMVVIFCGIKTAMTAHSRFNALLACGITAIIALQTLLNMAVVTGSIPPTGLPLPFISSGGSSLVVFMYAVGILLRINSETEKSQILPLCHKM